MNRRRRTVKIIKSVGIKERRNPCSSSRREKIEKIKAIVCPKTNYYRLKYKNKFYSVGDFVLLNEKGRDEYVIAKLLRIVPINGIRRYSFWPTMEVQK
jgi:hypothetical protein